MNGDPEKIMKVRQAVSNLMPHFGLSWDGVSCKEDSLTVGSRRDVPYHCGSDAESFYLIPSSKIGEISTMSGGVKLLVPSSERFIVLGDTVNDRTIGHETTHWLHEQFSGSEALQYATSTHEEMEKDPFGSQPASLLVEGLAMIGGHINKTGKVPLGVMNGLPSPRELFRFSLDQASQHKKQLVGVYLGLSNY